MTLESRTRAALEAMGWRAGLCQATRNGYKFDLFGFADLIAYRSTFEGVTAIQVSSLTHRAEKLRMLTEPREPSKALDEEGAWRWMQKEQQRIVGMVEFLRAGNRIECWLWKKRGAKWIPEVHRVVIGPGNVLMAELKTEVQKSLRLRK